MDKDLQTIWALLQTLEVSNKYPQLKPLHDQALRELTVYAQAAAEAWAEEKAKLEAKAAENKPKAVPADEVETPSIKRKVV